MSDQFSILPPSSGSMKPDPSGQTQPAEPAASQRRRWMAVLARAAAADIVALLADYGKLPDHSILRGPEGGLVMLRGRAGGGGAPFNLGEMTVTRCSVRTGGGQIGHAYVAGRDARQAELAALVDAMMQDPHAAAELDARVITPLQRAQVARRDAKSRQAAATQVQFFAMQTMRT